MPTTVRPRCFANCDATMPTAPVVAERTMVSPLWVLRLE